MKDAFTVKLLEDGTSSVTSESFSDENHLKAEQVRAWIQSKLGGSSETVRNQDAHAYAHEHGLEHEHN